MAAHQKKDENFEMVEETPEEVPVSEETPVEEEKEEVPVINKTPEGLATETPEEAAARYHIDTEVTEEDDENPRVEYFKTEAKQVPAGTHLHPDVAKDVMQKGISHHTTDSAQVVREVSVGYDFADDAEQNDKF